MDAAKIEVLKDIVDNFEENPSLLDTPPLEFYKKFLQRCASQSWVFEKSVEFNGNKIEEHHRKSKNNIENEENNNAPSPHSRSLVPKSQWSLKGRFNIIRSIGEECIQEDELKKLLANKSDIICYDGFEPSGRMHIAQGVMKAISIKKMTSAGVKVKIWIADLFAEMNKKMGGDLEKIQVIGHYMIEIWKALGIGIGIEKDLVEFVWASEEISSRPREYFSLVTDIASRNSLSRILRCCQIMGRSEKDELWASQIFYPCMQCADIFFLKADICQLGMDQRKVNMLAREYCDDIKRKNKPIILSHHMLPGLLEGQEKMSKSDPSSSIFMEDDEVEVNVKIKNAFYPPKVVENNPCLEYIKHLIFPLHEEFTVERKTFKSFEELIVDYESGEVHAGNLKLALAEALNHILQPVRDRFINDPKAKELLKRVKVELNAKKIEEHLPKSENNVENEENNINENLPSQLLHSVSLVPELQPSLKKRFNIIRSIGEECTYEDELKKLLANKSQIICYDGFEPSGRMHIAEGVIKAISVKKMISAGVKVKLWIADLFARMNKKLGGDEKKIKVVGEYMIEIWKAMEMNIEGQVEFLWASDEICSRSREYDSILKDISKRFKVSRILRCREIMGQSEKDELLASHVLYPCMQCADIFFLKADICQMGMDQHEVNMLAREYCDDIKRKDKPIIVSHHILPGLHEGQKKMSKTDPSSCIFMEDEEVDVNVKIKKAFCPPKVVENNPCLELIKHLIFPSFKEFTVERKPNNGGDKTFKSFEELIVDYESGEMHPGDLKPAIAKALNRILQPVRDHFIKDPKAMELLKRVKSYRVTR